MIVPETESPRVIAFYLPQFHCIPENDRWWGQGFTEWSNVRRAKSLFDSHRQPRVPLNSYYYDLTTLSAHKWQSDLARLYGVDGFCYYHYWFNGRKLLEKPAELILKKGIPDFPFCFSWANESWTRSWNGQSGKVLIKQDYGGPNEWKAHFDYLLPFFKDKRYIRYNGKPVFLIYKPRAFKAMSQMLSCWQLWAVEERIEGIYFVGTQTSFDDERTNQGFSASACFEPWLTIAKRVGLSQRLKWAIKRAAGASFSLQNRELLYNPWSYDSIWSYILSRDYQTNEFRGAFVDWDNTPRRGQNSRIIMGGSPVKFGFYMKRQLHLAMNEGSPFVFLNAWNEWAEGAYLEPDTDYEYSYLEELQQAVKSLADSKSVA